MSFMVLSIVRLYRSVAPPLSQQLYYTRVPRAVGASHPAISAEAKNATSAVHSEETIIARVGEEIENIGAKLQIAQAQLEEQRTMAAAFRQGNLVKTPRSAVSTGRPQEGNRA